MYRVYGGRAGIDGRSWTPVDPTRYGPDGFRVVAGLPDRDNAGTEILVGRLISPAGVLVRAAEPVSANMNWGGGPAGASYRYYGGGLPEYSVPSPAAQIQITRIVMPIRPYGGPPAGCTPAPVGCVGEGPWAGP